MTLSVFPTANFFVLFCAADVRDYLTYGKINEFCLVLEPLAKCFRLSFDNQIRLQCKAIKPKTKINFTVFDYE